MEPLDAPTIRKQGILTKQGGTDGGHRNWRDRYMVLTDERLEYYPSQSAFVAKKEPNVIRLNAYFVSVAENSKNFEFTVHAYPKSVVCRARSEQEMSEWIRALMQPLETLRRSAADVRLERLAEEVKLEEDVAAGKYAGESTADDAAAAGGGGGTELTA